MERLTLARARERVAEQTSAHLSVCEIDWTQPGREALLVAGLLGRADDLSERYALQAIALALLGYHAHLAYTAGQDAVLDNWARHARAERAARKKAAQAIHWIFAGDWYVARIGRKYTARCRVGAGAHGALEVRDGGLTVAVLDAPGSIEAASRKVRTWLRKEGR